MFKKILVVVGLGGLLYWIARERLGGSADEFAFTEIPPDEIVDGVM
jgi:hypothetical protein